MRSFVLKCTLLILVSFLLGAPDPRVQAQADEADVSTGPILESLEGAQSIQVNGDDGSVRTESAGAELRNGDWWEMPAGSVGRFIFRQGSQALLTGGSRVESREVFLDESATKIPSLIVAHGEVRAQVDPATPDELAKVKLAPDAKRPLRFLIRTKTAVMGVRGTDFIVEASEGQSAIHTMTGTVDVGRDDYEVKSGKAQPVAANQFAESQEGHGVSPSKSFEPGQYLNQFHQKFPRMEGAWKRAAADAHTGMLRQRFQEIHQSHLPGHSRLQPATQPHPPQARKQTRKKSVLAKRNRARAQRQPASKPAASKPVTRAPASQPRAAKVPPQRKPAAQKPQPRAKAKKKQRPANGR